MGQGRNALNYGGAPFPEKSGIVNLSKIGSGTNWIKYFCQTPDLDSIPNWATFVKEVFDLIFSLESDKMTALWTNESITFTFYVIISNSIPNWATFVKEVFWFDV